MTRSTFKPRPEQMALYPDVSGNTINGLGDAERRQPSYVYWGNSPDDVAHGDVQRWFYTDHLPRLPDVARLGPLTRVELLPMDPSGGDGAVLLSAQGLNDKPVQL